jgi:hypothetical protein
MTFPMRRREMGVALLGAALLSGGWFAFSLASPAEAQDDVPASIAVAKVDAVDPMQEVTPEREAAAETFARLHHPDLAALLARLKEGRQSDYDNAVRALFRESERLAKLKSRDAERYAIELEVWKTGSRIQLATARLAMEESPALKAELLTLLEARLALKTQLVQLERKKLSARLEKLNADLKDLQTKPGAQAEAELEKLLKAAQPKAAQAAKQRSGAKPKPKSDDKPATPKSDRGKNSDSKSTPTISTPTSVRPDAAASSR